MTVVIGINAFHGDSSACLLRDGDLVAAAEEERFRRIKHWAGFPSESIAYCLASAGIRLEQVEHVAINRDPRASLGRKVGFTLARRPSPNLVVERLRNRKNWRSTEQSLVAAFPSDTFRGKIHHVEHHLAHLASAYLASPFNEAVAVSVDGFGDFASAGWGVGMGPQVRVDGRVYFPHSLGIFYQAVTQYLGFPNYGDEYKVMGLAPYGEPTYVDQMREIVKICNDGSFRLNLKYFRHHKENIEYTWDNCSPRTGVLYSPSLEMLLGPCRSADQPIEQHHKDIARSVQAMYEEAFFNLLRKIHDRYGHDDLVLAGGCAMNSVANGKVYHNTPFRRMYVQAAAGDAGGAIGAAYIAWNRLQPKLRPSPMNHAYWGPEFSDDEIGAVLAECEPALAERGCLVEKIKEEGDLCRRGSLAISQGKVVGWFQGRMEWGPRALGNRSIICDPRRADMKEILNRKIKRRESFRPFAPSVLREFCSEWFETDDDVPFMTAVFQIRPEQRSRIPAVTHVDGSGRLQTVHRNTNPRYHRLIREFHALTGVPMVLNTSFNENEPVVCRPEEALDCFLRTKMDVLVLDNYYITRN